MPVGILLVLMAGALASGYPVAFALPGSAILTILLAAGCGHVRVDVFYSQFRDRMKGKVNAWGAVLLGIIFCWVVMVMGMSTKSSLINAITGRKALARRHDGGNSEWLSRCMTALSRCVSC